MPSTVPLFLVDAFSHGPFTGNPAGVCPLEGPEDETWMQNVAQEMNQAETAFVWPENDSWRLRWFTPDVEVDLCGHATLATAAVLWSTGRAEGDLAFETRSGTLTCRPVDEAIEMDFPAEPIVAAPLPEAISSFGDVLFTGQNRMDWFMEVADEATLRSAAPDLAAIARLDARGLIVTSRGEETDFVSRFFAPQSGVAEDSVTGSAHCGLGPYWAAKLGRTDLVGFQASRRGGFVHVGVRDARILLRGQARIVLTGTWLR
jgi:predicted PhzF superfamily epimerase YddE/YHI9